MRAVSSPILLALAIAFTLPSAPLSAQNAAPPANAAAPAPATDPTTSPLRRVGGGVTQPKLLSGVDAQYSPEARKAKVNAIVLVNLIVDANGLPQNVHVLRGVGMGLDEKALEAVKQYTFQPATEGGKPEPILLNIEVNFQNFDPPEVIHSVPLKVTDEARQNSMIGEIVVGLIVDTHGHPQEVRIVHGVGMGMDERAVEAVRQYRFRPFVENGQPVAKSTTFGLEFNAK